MSRYKKLKAKLKEQEQAIKEQNDLITELTSDETKAKVKELEKEVEENETLLVKAKAKIETLEKDILGGGEENTKPMSKEEIAKLKKELEERLK